MERRQKKQANDNLFRVTNELRSYYYEKWFAHDKEVKARSALRQLLKEYLSEESPFYKEANTALAAVDGVNMISDTLSDEFNLEKGRGSYWVAYRETGDNELLQMAILYYYDAHTNTLTVSQMVITCQGVVHEIDEHHAIRSRPPIYTLFKETLQEMREMFPDIRFISIVIASRGSLMAVKKLWGKDANKATADSRRYEFDLEHLCATCNSPHLEHHLTGVGANFCSRKCASLFWALLEQMEHPLTEQYYVSLF